jgi:hypothetical protein
MKMKDATETPRRGGVRRAITACLFRRNAPSAVIVLRVSVALQDGAR